MTDAEREEIKRFVREEVARQLETVRRELTKTNAVATLRVTGKPE